MMTPVYIYISIIIIVSLLSALFLIRNTKVCRFRIYVLDMSYNHLQDYFDDIDWDSIDWENKYKLHEKASSLYQQINNKYEYNEMLYSIKPLKLDKWFTEEEVNFIEFGTLN